jgi:hypothetical protein
MTNAKSKVIKKSVNGFSNKHCHHLRINEFIVFKHAANQELVNIQITRHLAEKSKKLLIHTI